MIEHLRPAMARLMLMEILRVLKPGGICRLVAPSLEWALSLYNEEHPEACLRGIFQEDEENVKNRHQWMYTSKSLSRLMRETGFGDVVPRKFREGELPDLERIDNRPDNSIYVEGKKPLVG
jgi:predicted SAM-dependent methyltransferase